MVVKTQHWIDLELAAKTILGEINESYNVSHNVHLPGRLTGVARQIDVLMESADGAHTVVVDCKDWKRKVTVRDAGAFASLMEDVGAEWGLMICNAGFSEGAANLAKTKGFNLAALHDFEREKWQLEVEVPVVWQRVWPVEIKALLRVKLDPALAPKSTTEVKIHAFDHAFGSLEEVIGDAWLRSDLRGYPFALMLIPDLVYEWTEGAATMICQANLVLSVKSSRRLLVSYIPPVRSRGLLDGETRAFHTSYLDLAATAAQTPNVWFEPDEPDNLLCELRGALITITELAVLTVTAGEWPTVFQRSIDWEVSDVDRLRAIQFSAPVDLGTWSYPNVALRDLEAFDGDRADENRFLLGGQRVRAGLTRIVHGATA